MSGNLKTITTEQLPKEREAAIYAGQQTKNTINTYRKSTLGQAVNANDTFSNQQTRATNERSDKSQNSQFVHN